MHFFRIWWFVFCVSKTSKLGQLNESYQNFFFLYDRTFSFLKANSLLMAYYIFKIMTYYTTLLNIVGYGSLILYKLDSVVIKLVRIINSLSANATKWSNTLK